RGAAAAYRARDGVSRKRESARAGRQGPPAAPTRDTRSAVLCVADPGGLAGQVSEIEQARATHDTPRDELDLVDARAVKQEDALYADVEAHLADREGAANTGSVSLQDDPLEHLDALLLALDDPIVDAHRVTHPELRQPLAGVT